MGTRKQLTRNQELRRQRVRNARDIRSEAASHAENEFVEGGSMLKVSEFISSRRFEIEQLQTAIHKSRASSSMRVFQSLPRKLRRRKASHNVRRIPKRMRNRAIREMTKSEQLIRNGTRSAVSRRQHGMTTRKLYKFRMALNLLRLASRSTSLQLALPNEFGVGKFRLRAAIRSLRRQIKEARKGKSLRRLNNEMGSYDNSSLNSLAPKPLGRIKYMKRQRFFTWLPTHVWNSKRSHMIKRWGFKIPWSPTQKCFRMTHRLISDTAASNGAMCADTSYVATIVLTSGSSEELTAFVRSLTNGRAQKKKYKESQHLFEGLFYEDEKKAPVGPGSILWVDFSTVMIRVHPAIFETIFKLAITAKIDVQDCRYAIASITISGAKSLQALSQIIRTTSESDSYKQFKSLCRISDTTVLPEKTKFAFNVIDPRHLSAPKNITPPKYTAYDDVLKLQDEYPSVEITSVLRQLCDPASREKSYKNQQTLKKLALRRRELISQPTTVSSIPFNPHFDPSIPLVILKQPKTANWIVLLPWYWMLPFWYQLNRVSHVYHMGLKQIHQQCYESGILYFPDDYPFTYHGYIQNLEYKQQASKTTWELKPVAKRLHYSKIKSIHHQDCPGYPGEIGNCFSCDWKLLQILRNGISYLGNDIKTHDPLRTTQYDPTTGLQQINYIKDLLDLHHSSNENSEALPIKFFNKNFSQFNREPDPKLSSHPQIVITSTPLSLIAVVCTSTGRGHFKDNARIYRIPEKDVKYWMKEAKGTYRSTGKIYHATSHPLPQINDLIGYITSGTYHLGKGKSVGNGFIATEHAAVSGNNYVLIRNVGTNFYRLSQWEQITI